MAVKGLSTRKVVETMQFLDDMRKLSPTMPIGELMYLLQASLLDEPSSETISLNAGCASSSSSRYLTHLSTGKAHKGIEGLELLEVTPNIINSREKIVTVSSKGEALLLKHFGRERNANLSQG